MEEAAEATRVTWAPREGALSRGQGGRGLGLVLEQRGTTVPSSQHPSRPLLSVLVSMRVKAEAVAFHGFNPPSLITRKAGRLQCGC